jgi:hypothetical protein
VRHLSEGTLRRIQDEPLALSADEQRHFESCPECRERFVQVEQEAGRVADLLALPEIRPDVAAGLAMVNARLASSTRGSPLGILATRSSALSWRLPRSTRPLAALALAALILVTFAATGVAQHLSQIFELKTIVGVKVSPSELQKTPRLLDYGTFRWVEGPPEPTEVANASTAAARTGLPVLKPSYLPTSATGPAAYAVVGHSTASFTFDSKKLEKSAAAAGVTVPPMPASIDGSTLYISGGPGLVEYFSSAAVPSSTSSATGLPLLVIGEAKSPIVTSTGATAEQLEAYALAQPGIPADLRAQLQSIKDPSSTLPIPIPSQFAASRTVKVQGVNGLLVDAGLGAAVVWQRGGIVYAVGGQLTPDQVLQIANSIS